MPPVLSDDCWYYVFSYLQDDHHTLFQSLLVDKTLFRSAVPWLYRRPLVTFKDKIPQERLKKLETLLFSQASRVNEDGQDQSSSLSTMPSSSSSSSPSTSTLLLLPLSSPPNLHQSRRTENAFSNFDYYSLVHEMADNLVGHPGFKQPQRRFSSLNSTKENKETSIRIQYLKTFSSKIKTFELKTEEHFLMEKSLPFLCSLTELKFVLSGDQQKPEYLDSVSNAIGIHQKSFPGLLQKVSFFPACDADMAVRVRDSLAGISGGISENVGCGDGYNDGGHPTRWGIDALTLNLDTGESGSLESNTTANLLTVFQSVDLPTQLRSIVVQMQNKEQKWIIPLSIFLSKCRDLDTVCFRECPTEILSWAVHQKEYQKTIEAASVGTGGAAAAVKHSLSRELETTTTTASLSRQLRLQGSSLQAPAQWKKIMAVYQSSQNEGTNAMWRNILDGFGHCLQELRFALPSVINGNFDHPDIDKFSISSSDHLPHLQCLLVYCSAFGEFSPLSVPQLKILELRIFRDDVLVENDGGHGEDQQTRFPVRKFPQSLQQLRLQDRTLILQGLRSTIGHLYQLEGFDVGANGDWNRRTEAQRNLDQENAKRAFDQELLLDCDTDRSNAKGRNMTDAEGTLAKDEGNEEQMEQGYGSWSLPRLSNVGFGGYTAVYMNINILFVGPNITSIVLYDDGGTRQKLDLSNFFGRAKALFCVFPKLEILEMFAPVKLDPTDFRHLLGFPFTTDDIVGCDHADNKYMFPSLTKIVLDTFQPTNDDEGIDEYLKVIQDRFLVSRRSDSGNYISLNDDDDDDADDEEPEDEEEGNEDGDDRDDGDDDSDSDVDDGDTDDECDGDGDHGRQLSLTLTGWLNYNQWNIWLDDMDLKPTEKAPKGFSLTLKNFHKTYCNRKKSAR